MIKAYFDNSISDGIVTRNDIINMATLTLADFMKDIIKDILENK